MDLMDSIAEALRADGAESPFSCSWVLVVMITCYCVPLDDGRLGKCRAQGFPPKHFPQC